MKGAFVFALLFFVLLGNSQDPCFLKQIYDPAVDAADIRKIPGKLDEYVHSFNGCKIPDFSATTIKRDKISSDRFDGKVVVLNFWFTRCKPCVAEFPSLNKLVEEFSERQVEFISFALDAESTLDSFLLSHPLKYEVVADADSIASLFKVTPYPTNIILDRNNRVFKIFHGGAITTDKALENYDKFRPYVEEALRKEKR